MINEKLYTDDEDLGIDYIVDKVYEYCDKREVVLWGKYRISDEIKERLKSRYGVKTAFYVDSDTTKIDNICVFSSECLKGKAGQYYVVVPLAFYQSLKDELVRGGYRKDLDYYYFSDCIVEQRSDYYEDSHGNKIIGKYQNLKFAFSGFNSVIEIGKGVRFRDSVIYMHNDSRVIIGDKTDIEECNFSVENECNIEIGQECKIFDLNLTGGNASSLILKNGVMIRGKSHWGLCKKAKFWVGCNGKFLDGRIIMSDNSSMKIGKNVDVGFGHDWVLNEYTECVVGNDCLFSYDIYLRTNDGHSVFDLKSGKNINSTYEISKNKKILIGNHVWIGMRSTVLYDTEIGDGSIIGAASLIKGKIPNNCVAAGIPAKVIRTDVAWSYENMADDLAACGEDYIRFTDYNTL